METLNDVRALLIRQHAAKLETEKQLRDTSPGTKEFGDLMSRLRQHLSDMKATNDHMKRLLTGHQPTLL